MAFQNTRPSIAREDFEYAQEVIRKLSDYYSRGGLGRCGRQVLPGTVYPRPAAQ